MRKQAAKRSKKAVATASPRPLEPMERRSMIARLAYLHAELRSFRCGDPVQDWLEAEAEIDRGLKTNA
jgi:hypothetical protein